MNIRLAIILAILGALCAKPLFACYESTITKPSPFMGNHGETFTLSDGTVWEVQYEYEYLYEYRPEVVVCPDKGYLMIEGDRIDIRQVAQRSAGSYGMPSSQSYVESKVNGQWKGWSGDSQIKLMNGQVWQQTDNKRIYYSAKRGVDTATIKSAALGSYMMKLDDGLQFRAKRLK